MSQRIMTNPKNNQLELVDILKSGGNPVAIVFSTHTVEDIDEINKLFQKSDNFNRTTNSRGSLDPFELL